MKEDQKPNNPYMLQLMLRQIHDGFSMRCRNGVDHLDNLLLAMEKRGTATDAN